MLSPQAALELILKHTHTLPRATLALDKALGHYLAHSVRANRDMPATDRSAMDGYAVRSEDITSIPCNLRVKGEVAAGSPARTRVTAGSCVRIMTGAVIPPGADTVVRVEDTEKNQDRITVHSPITAGANILRRGENAHKGEVLLARGALLGPSQIGVCAAVGKDKVSVYSRPRIILLCTGEELRAAGEKVKLHEIHNSNGPALCAMLAQWGYGKIAWRIVGDEVNKLTSKLRRALAGHDIAILTGGVSVGAYDFVPEAVRRLGARVRFHGVAIKPGRPLLYATLPGNQQIFGLPGNPLSAMTGLCEFVLPALRRMAGLAADKCHLSLRVPLASPLTIKTGRRTHFHLAQLLWKPDGPCTVPVVSQGSADLVAGGRADGAIAVPLGVESLDAGAVVDFRPWRPLP